MLARLTDRGFRQYPDYNENCFGLLARLVYCAGEFIASGYQGPNNDALDLRLTSSVARAKDHKTGSSYVVRGSSNPAQNSCSSSRSNCWARC
jgi:hypothetical protein